MATEVLMPQMGESIAEGTITKWLAKVGDTIERDQPLLEISTDKVDSEIPSPASGVLLEIRSQEGETVPVNETVGMIGQPGELGAGVPAASVPATATSALATAASALATASALESNLSDLSDLSDAPPSELPLTERLRRFSSPLVRNIAKKEDIDLARLTGTGLHGRVTKKDILGYLASRTSAPATSALAMSAPAMAGAASATPAAATAPSRRSAGTFSVPAYHKGENVEVVPMSRIRQITAEHMVYSKATSAHVTTVFHVDMSKVATLRQRVKTRFHKETGTKLSFMPFIFQAVCKALRKYPILNAAVDGSNIVYKKDINLGMAVALDPGLIVPVIRRADELSLVGLAKTANDLAGRARTRKLRPEETQSGTFTITNPGVFGSLFGTPVINQPQVAILGIGTIEKRPVVRTDADGHDSLAIRTMTYLAITFDHRVVDGADADHFMVAVKTSLETDGWDDLSLFLG